MGIVNLLVARGVDATRLHGSEEVLVRAAPEQVYELLSDVTRMGEWSPECFRCEWIGDAVSAHCGARFRGHNRRGWIRWSTECTVTHYEPYGAFGFETKPPVGKAQSRWRFDLEPDADCTVLRESFEVLWYVRPCLASFSGGSQTDSSSCARAWSRLCNRLNAPPKRRDAPSGAAPDRCRLGSNREDRGNDQADHHERRRDFGPLA